MAIAEVPKLNFGVSFAFTGAFPAEYNAFFKTYAEAEAAAQTAEAIGSTNTLYYFTQILHVTEGEESGLYEIQTDRTLKKVGSGEGGTSDRPADRIMSESGDCAIYVNQSDGLSVVEKLETVKQAGVYTLYVQKGCPDNPAGSEAISSSLRGMCHITLTKEANGSMYAWILLFDQSGQAYSRYTSASSSGAWVAHSGGSSGGGGYNIGSGLKLDAATNTLSVDTAQAVEEDNTKPVTSAAVFTEVGNINALLATI